MKINKWDEIVFALLLISAILTVAAPRMKANLIQDRYILDFETEIEEGDDVFHWETADADMLINLGWFNLLTTGIFAVFLIMTGLIITKLIVKKAGWLRN